MMRVRVLIRGKVQGVYFRESTRKEAQSRGVTGWVRNRSDGGVEGLFAGPAASVHGLLAWCRGGPPAAHVHSLDWHEEPGPVPSAFEVQRGLH